MSRLTLERKIGEQIVCCTPSGDQIIFTIKDAGGGKAKVIVEAPIEISVDRMEVLQRKLAYGLNHAGLPPLPPLHVHQLQSSPSCGDIGHPSHPALDLLG